MPILAPVYSEKNSTKCSKNSDNQNFKSVEFKLADKNVRHSEKNKSSAIMEISKI